MEKTRLDKWLWTVRLYKSRTQATEACRMGKVKSKGEALKASAMVGPGIKLEIRKNGFNFIYQIVQVLKSRVAAPIAVNCYTNLTPESELNKYEQWYAVQKKSVLRTKGSGRPTKKERREMDSFLEEE